MSVLNIYNQKTFMVPEVTPGVRVYPTSHGQSVILSGYISAERNVSYTDSAEVRNSLNLKDQVKDKDAAGTLSLPIYVRPGGVNLWVAAIMVGGIDAVVTTIPFDTLTGTVNAPGIVKIGDELVYYLSYNAVTGALENCVRGYRGTTAAAHVEDIPIQSYDCIGEPMGDLILESLQGEKMAWTALIDSAGLTGVATSVTFDGLSGHRPADYGVIEFDNGTNRELIKYTGLTLIEGATAGTFTGCTRVYGGYTDAGNDTALVGADGDVLRIVGPTYKQKIGRPSFSLWWELDGIFYCAAGCTINNLSHTGENKGYPGFDIAGGFMTRIHAGKALIASNVSGVLTLTTTGASKRFSVGSRIRFYDVSASNEENNSEAGYIITAVSHTLNTVTVASCPITVEGGVDYIQGYLPSDFEIGTTLKAEDSQILLDGVDKEPTAFTLTVDAPVQYIDNQITPNPISEYIGNKRSITQSITQLLQNSELSLYQDADDDVKVSNLIRWGDATAGETVLCYTPKNTMQVPKEAQSEPLVEVAIDLTALDTYSEDSLFLIFI